MAMSPSRIDPLRRSGGGAFTNRHGADFEVADRDRGPFAGRITTLFGASALARRRTPSGVQLRPAAASTTRPGSARGSRGRSSGTVPPWCTGCVRAARRQVQAGWARGRRRGGGGPPGGGGGGGECGGPGGGGACPAAGRQVHRYCAELRTHSATRGGGHSLKPRAARSGSCSPRGPSSVSARSSG